MSEQEGSEDSEHAIITARKTDPGGFNLKPSVWRVIKLDILPLDIVGVKTNRIEVIVTHLSLAKLFPRGLGYVNINPCIRENCTKGMSIRGPTQQLGLFYK